MNKVKIEPVTLKDHELFIDRVMTQLHTAPRHILISSLMGLATNVVELTTHETDNVTMGITVLHIINETLKVNENEPVHFQRLNQVSDIAEGEA